MDKLDFKKLYPDLYLPKASPCRVEIPSMNCLMVDGTGAPEGTSYQEATQLLYSIAFTIKMSKMGTFLPEGYTDFAVPPLEGLWDCGPEGFSAEREAWIWTSFLRMPEFVTAQVLNWAAEQVLRKKPEAFVKRLRLERFKEGLCVQMLHVGPYSEESRTLEAMRAYIKENGLIDESGRERRHHELYLGDPRKSAPEKLKTVLRHPVREAE